MPLITVEINQAIASIAGIDKSKVVTEIEIGEGATTGDLLSELVEQYGEKLGRILFGSDRKNLGDALLAVNDRLIDCRKALETELQEGDTICIFMAYAGG